MSTIRVDNFGPSAGGTTYSADGISKHWVSFDASTDNIIVSLNTSSLTDGGTGLTTINFTNSFSSSDLTPVTSQGTGGTSHMNSNNFSTSSYDYRTYDRTNPANSVDLGSNFVAVMGELA